MRKKEERSVSSADLREDLDRELRYNIKARAVQEIVTDENGNETTVTSTVEVPEINHDNSEYARCFDETCIGWTRDPEYNMMFVTQIQNWANDRLQSKGYLYLNEVYEMLGFQRTKAGQVVGWLYNGDGDNYVDFGIFNINDKQKRRFVNGYEKSIWLDFNVDGNILDKMS